MGRLVVTAQMTLDGVIDQTEGWFTPDGDHEDHSAVQLGAADALLLGRETYQGLSKIWPTTTDTTGFADRVNSLPKYVVSATLRPPLDWNATLVDGELVSSIAAIKDSLEGSLLSYGIGRLARSLLMAGLVDEVVLYVHPVIWGKGGTRPFHDGEPLRLRLVEATTFRSGVALLTYEGTAAHRPEHHTHGQA